MVSNKNTINNSAETASTSQGSKWDILKNVKNALFGGNKKKTAKSAEAQPKEQHIEAQPKKQHIEDQPKEQYDEVQDEYGRKVLIPHKEAQENKIINFFQKSVASPNIPSQNDQKDFYEKLSNYQITLGDEEEYIKKVCRPGEKLSQDENGNQEKVYDHDGLENLLSQILDRNAPDLYLVYKEALDYPDQTYSTQLIPLMSACETPREFNRLVGNRVIDNLCQSKKCSYSEAKKAVEHFKSVVYGKQYEYQEAFTQLRAKSAQYAANTPEENSIYSDTYTIPNQGYEPDYQEEPQYEDPEPQYEEPQYEEPQYEEPQYEKFQYDEPQYEEPQYENPQYQEGNESFYDQGEVKEALKNPEIASQSMSVKDKFEWFRQNGKVMYSGEGQRAITNPNGLHSVNEDTTYTNEVKKIFAMFDGAGGSANGAAASQACANLLDEFLNRFPYVEENYPVLEGDPEGETSYTRYLRHAASYIQSMLEKNKNLTGSYSTGLITKFSEDNRRLDFINIGDSRLYRIRNGKVEQISTDQGFGYQITSSLGTGPDGRGNYDLNPNFGSIDIQEGDVILLCSDGIMGDYKYQEIDENTIINIVENASSSQEIADNLCFASKKSDDTSVIALKF